MKGILRDNKESNVGFGGEGARVHVPTSGENRGVEGHAQDSRPKLARGAPPSAVGKAHGGARVRG